MFTETKGYDLRNAKPSKILDQLAKHAQFRDWNTYTSYWKDIECDGNR